MQKYKDSNFKNDFQYRSEIDHLNDTYEMIKSYINIMSVEYELPNEVRIKLFEKLDELYDSYIVNIRLVSIIDRYSEKLNDKFLYFNNIMESEGMKSFAKINHKELTNARN